MFLRKGSWVGSSPSSRRCRLAYLFGGGGKSKGCPLVGQKRRVWRRDAPFRGSGAGLGQGRL